MYLPQHVGTNDIHLLIEFIAKRVNPGEAMQHFCEIEEATDQFLRLVDGEGTAITIQPLACRGSSLSIKNEWCFSQQVISRR